MIEYITGKSIFESNAQTLVNPVNCVGIMGAGLALQFKNLFPNMFQEYKELCDNGGLSVGKSFLYKGNKWIYNFPTKVHWKDNSKIEYINDGLKNFVDTYKRRQIRSIAFPKIGAGLGGLYWEDVKKSMEYYLKNIDIPVSVCL